MKYKIEFTSPNATENIFSVITNGISEQDAMQNIFFFVDSLLKVIYGMDHKGVRFVTVNYF